MTKENKNEKWCAVSAFGRTAVYPASKSDSGIFCSTEHQILPETDIKFREAYEYIVKLHNDRLRFKQKQRNKKKNRSDYTELSKNPSPAEGWIIGGVPVDNGGKKTCHRCKQCKDNCEFYDKGICRGIIYPMNPPKYGKCEFDEQPNTQDEAKPVVKGSASKSGLAGLRGRYIECLVQEEK